MRISLWKVWGHLGSSLGCLRSSLGRLRLASGLYYRRGCHRGCQRWAEGVAVSCHLKLSHVIIWRRPRWPLIFLTIGWPQTAWMTTSMTTSLMTASDVRGVVYGHLHHRRPEADEDDILIYQTLPLLAIYMDTSTNFKTIFQYLWLIAQVSTHDN